MIEVSVTDRERIVAAAYRLLAASKGSSVPITEVLVAAGLSTRAFYRHFDSKDGLLLAMFRSDSDRALAALGAYADQAPTARDGLEAWITGMLRLAADPRRRRRVLVLRSDEVTRAKGFNSERDRYEAAQDAALARLLARGLNDGSLPRARPTADAPFVRAAVHEAFSEQMLLPVGADVTDAVHRLMDFVIRAAGAQPGVSAPPA